MATGKNKMGGKEIMHKKMREVVMWSLVKLGKISIEGSPLGVKVKYKLKRENIKELESNIGGDVDEIIRIIEKYTTLIGDELYQYIQKNVANRNLTSYIDDIIERIDQ